MPGVDASDVPHELLSLVVPVFNEEDGIAAFHERATAALEALPDLDHEIVYVDDGSLDASHSVLCGFADADPRVSVIKFSRNFGHQIAITAGLDHARGDCVVVIDSDLQDPPEVIADMVREWRDGYDVVYGRRKRREGETRFKLLTAALFYRFLRAMTRIDIPSDVGDFRLVSRRAADEMRKLREKDRFVRGLASWIGFRQTDVLYSRDARFAGDTKYPLRKMLRFALDGITSFSTVPLKLATWLGYAASFLAFVYLLSIPIQFAFDITVPGFSTIMVAMLFLGGTQLICLGIIGEYIGRIFNETKPRPMYIVDEIAGPAPPRVDA
jgi:dolichol-phosphate mannosyltransferase